MSLTKRIIYVATNSIGFEVDLASQNNNGIIQAFVRRELVRGRLFPEILAEYVPIVENGSPVAVKLLNEFYYYDSATETMQTPTADSDTIDLPEDYIVANANQILKAEKNIYIKQMPFDYSKDDDQQDGSYQPIKGLVTDSTFLAISTENFCNIKETPKHGDLVTIGKDNWLIDEVHESFVYTPKEKRNLRITLKKTKK